MDLPMPHEENATVRQRPRPEQAPDSNEPARFLRNLTSLPDADFASTYLPAIAAVLARYGELPDPAAAARALLLALKAALKRRRAFILPRFTQAEDSWRIRECASYAVAVTVLVEHAHVVLSADRSDPPADPDSWSLILADPAADADEPSARAALFHAIVPAQGRRWIAREPLVQTLIASYFTDTEPNELRDIVGPVVAGFPHDRQAARQPRKDDSQPCGADDVPNHPPGSSSGNVAGLLARFLEWTRATLGRGRPPGHGSARPGTSETNVTESVLPVHHNATSPDAAPAAPRPEAAHFPPTEPRSDTPVTPAPPLTPNAPDRSSQSSAPTALTRSPPASKPSRNRRSGPRVADLLDRLPTAPARRDTIPDPRGLARKPDIGDHGAATARIGHQADYVRSLAADNASRPSQQTIPFLFPGPIPDAVGQPLDVHVLFPARTHAARVDPDAIAAWIAFRQHLVEALRSGAQTANGERSFVHLLEVGVFLVWPQVALPFADEHGVAPAAIKSAMRAAHVLAVNRADRQEDRHAFPALTGDPKVTSHGLVTLPEYLWPDASDRPVAPSGFVRPPAIYGQRYRRPS